MDSDAFVETAPGRLVPTSNGARAFVPDDLPPDITALDIETVNLLADAHGAVRELAGVGGMLPNPELLIAPFIRREAVLSSRIEGTVTSVEQLALFEARPDDRPERAETREVANYVAAVLEGLRALEDLPVSLRVVRGMHRRLMQGVRGEDKRPGELRDRQNWIGRTPLTPIEEARFVPPPVDEMVTSLNALERYVALRGKLPDLIEIALAHYQFETIHPFGDGNGRMGRALITLMLCDRKLLPQPLLHLSAYFERNRAEYYDRLLAVSQQARWMEWIRFFLEGVADQSRDAIKRFTALRDLRERYHRQVQAARNSALLARLIDSLFELPVTDVSRAARVTGITWAAAQRNVQKLLNADILVEIPPWGRGRAYMAPEILAVIRDAEI